MSSTITPLSACDLFLGFGVGGEAQGRGDQLLVGLHLDGAVDIIPDPAHGLHSGQSAVADGGIHIVPVLEGQLLQQHRGKLRVVQRAQGHIHPLHLGFKAGTAVADVLLPGALS